MQPRKKFVFWWLLVPALTTVSQSCMKLLALRMGDTAFGAEWFSKAAATPFFWAIFALEIANFVVWMRILSTVEISRAMPLSAIAYLSILTLGWFGFNEPFFALQLLGSVLIIIGVILIGSEKSPVTPLPAP